MKENKIQATLEISLGRIVRVDGNCDSEIWKDMKLAKDAFPNMRKVLRDRKIPFEIKSSSQLFDVYPTSYQ